MSRTSWFVFTVLVLFVSTVLAIFLQWLHGPFASNFCQTLHLPSRSDPSHRAVCRTVHLQVYIPGEDQQDCSCTQDRARPQSARVRGKAESGRFSGPTSSSCKPHRPTPPLCRLGQPEPFVKTSPKRLLRTRRSDEGTRPISTTLLRRRQQVAMQSL